MKSNTSGLLQKKKKQIFDLWMEQQIQNDALREDLMSNDDLRSQSDELLTALIESLKPGNFTNIEAPEFNRVNEILSDISVSRARQGFSPRETAVFILSLKESLNSVMKDEFKDDPEQLLSEALKVNKLIDSFSINTFETFIRSREEVILRQTSEITEISTPVIRVWEGIVALPIIGTLDSARTQVVMESLLQEIVATESSVAILDISGVPAVDSLVAQHLIKTVSATRLMGAECIISGIRPEIAQTIVHLGIDLSQIVTKSSLASALRYAFVMMKLEVVKKERKTINPVNG